MLFLGCSYNSFLFPLCYLDSNSTFVIFTVQQVMADVGPAPAIMEQLKQPVASVIKQEPHVSAAGDAALRMRKSLHPRRHPLAVKVC